MSQIKRRTVTYLTLKTHCVYFLCIKLISKNLICLFDEEYLDFVNFILQVRETETWVPLKNEASQDLESSGDSHNRDFEFAEITPTIDDEDGLDEDDDDDDDYYDDMSGSGGAEITDLEVIIQFLCHDNHWDAVEMDVSFLQCNCNQVAYISEETYYM